MAIAAPLMEISFLETRSTSNNSFLQWHSYSRRLCSNTGMCSTP